jgi:hypothetical protein
LKGFPVTYTFIPPTVEEGPAGGHWLFQRYTLSRGVSVYKLDGEYYEIRFPTQDDIEAADIFYMGGHEYVVSESEKDDLEAAGYDVVTS